MISRARRRAEITRILDNFKGLRCILSAGKVKGKEQLCSTKDADGRVYTDKQSIAEVFATFYENLYDCREDLRASLTDYPSARMGAEPFTVEELEGEMKTLKEGKCPDSAGLVAEMLKHGDATLRAAFLEPYNSVLFSEALLAARWRQ